MSLYLKRKPAIFNKLCAARCPSTISGTTLYKCDYYYYFPSVGVPKGGLKIMKAKQSWVRYSVDTVNGRQRIMQQNGTEALH